MDVMKNRFVEWNYRRLIYSREIFIPVFSYLLQIFLFFFLWNFSSENYVGEIYSLTVMDYFWAYSCCASKTRVVT